MSVNIVRCKTCGKSRRGGEEHFDYFLEVRKSGTRKVCDACHNWSYPEKIERTYWFCKRECLDEFLNNNKDEDFKDKW